MRIIWYVYVPKRMTFRGAERRWRSDRQRLVAAAALVAAVGCQGGIPASDVDAAGSLPEPDATAVRQVSVAESPALLQAADPKLAGFDGWPLVFSVSSTGYGTLECDISVWRGDQQLFATTSMIAAGQCVVLWEPSGLAVGALEARVAVREPGGEPVLAAAAAPVEVVRLGVSAVALDTMEPGRRVPLLYGAMGGVAQGYYLIPADAPVWKLGPDAAEAEGAVSLELADGSPRATPQPWSELRSPPLDDASPDGIEHDTYSLPVGVVAGATLLATATLSSDVAGTPGGGAPQQTQIRVAGIEQPFVHGGTVTRAADTSLVPAVGRYDLAFRWEFEALSASGTWVPVPGAVETVHRVYGVADVPRFDYSTTPHHPWVEVLDQVAGWVDGQTADPQAVGGMIVDGVYRDLGLVYDTEAGATTYTDYPGFSWGGAVFDLSAFLRRDWGNIINCSDAGSIVGTYATMVGLDFRYHILERYDGDGFDLNFIKAIGIDFFDDTPFDNGRGAFRYHAVVGPADGTIFDATLALDGDGTPGTPPHLELLASGMPLQDYLMALSSEGDSVVSDRDEQVRIR